MSCIMDSVNSKGAIMSITKEHLDQLMQEYDYNKNSVDDTLGFISYMFTLYENLEEK